MKRRDAAGVRDSHRTRDLSEIQSEIAGPAWRTPYTQRPPDSLCNAVLEAEIRKGFRPPSKRYMRWTFFGPDVRKAVLLPGTVRAGPGAKVDSHQEPAITTNRLSSVAGIKPVRITSASAGARRDQLRAELPTTAEMLYRRRADLIGDPVIGDYVALQWLEWNGGALRLTVTGQNICDQLKAQIA